MDKITIERQLLIEAKEYIEQAEERISFEWGMCKPYSQLVKDGDMPNIYYKIRDILNVTKE